MADVQLSSLGTVIQTAHEGLSDSAFKKYLASNLQTGTTYTLVLGDAGEIVEMNTPEKFFKNPKNERTKLFLSQILAH